MKSSREGRIEERKERLLKAADCSKMAAAGS